MFRAVWLALVIAMVALTQIAATTAVAPMAGAATQKMIIDTDFNTIGDDGQVAIMAAQLMAEGKIDLLGITLVTGNQWLNQETADALKAVERLGIDRKVGVYAGAHDPLVHDYKTLAGERALFGSFWSGAWEKPEPTLDQLVPPPDGFATHTRLQPQHAVDFIADAVKKYPHAVTILAIGPLTNIALAIRMHPEIVPLIGRIVYMAGAFEVPGNTTPAAELNVWFDPEAARIVIRQPIEQVFIPLDVTNTVPMTKAIFDAVTRNRDSIVARLFNSSEFAKTLVENPKATDYVYDTLALAYAVDPGFATDTKAVWADVDIAYGPGYGRTLGYSQQRAAAFMQKVTIVRRFDNDRFFHFFIDLLTRPVPVRLAH
jgi:inosine-uridine nucleoside N-ribohydrolase